MAMLRLVSSDYQEPPPPPPSSATPPRALNDREALDAVQQVYHDVLMGRIATFERARAILGLQGITFNQERRGWNYGDSHITERLIGLHGLLLNIEQGLHPDLVEVRKKLRHIEQHRASFRTLIDLQRYEDEYRHSPVFPQIHKEINALCAVKRSELSKGFRQRLNELSRTYNDERALQFKEDFFGTVYRPGCGLTIEDLWPSASDRMLLHRIKLQRSHSSYR